ncbi:MAG: lipoprotein [Rhodocyclaceae bacterium]
MPHSFKRAAAIAVVVAAAALGACGTKGPLTQIPKVPTQKTPAAAPVANDLNTAKDPAQ